MKRVRKRYIMGAIFALCCFLVVGYRLAHPVENLNDALFVAIREGDAQKVEALLKRGANPNGLGRYASDIDTRGIVKRIDSAFTGKYGIEENGFELRPALHHAIRYDAVMSVLLKHGADINGYPKNGSEANDEVDAFRSHTPLYTAIVENDIHAVKFLLDHGADYSRKIYRDEYVIGRARSPGMAEFLEPYRHKIHADQTRGFDLP